MNGMTDEQPDEPESTAVRVALWRAMHMLVDASPHVLQDKVGLQLVAQAWKRAPTDRARLRRP
jgi:hypothetical protein